MKLKRIVKEWFEYWSPQRKERYAKESKVLIEKYIVNPLGHLDIKKIEPSIILKELRKIEKTGKLEQMYKVLGHFKKIFRYAIACGKLKTNPAAELSYALQPRKSKHLATFFEKEKIGNLLFNISNYSQKQRRNQLLLMIHTFVRSGEIVSAEWKDFDFSTNTWNIPAEKMKMKRPHSVPLSEQVINILKDQRNLVNSNFVFPCKNNNKKHENASLPNLGLRHLGYKKEEICAHGFRAMAATILSELNFDTFLIEKELAHIDSNKTRAAYQRSDLLEKRRKMMQVWSDFLELQYARVLLKNFETTKG